MSLLIISTHPVQYHAPVFRLVQQQFQIPATVIYGSDFSVKGYMDREFGVSFSWDTDLLTGYTPIFLSHVDQGGARSYEKVSTAGLSTLLKTLDFNAVLVLGYYPFFNLRAFWLARHTHTPLLLRAEASDRNLQRTQLKQWLRDGVLTAFYRQFARILYIGEESHGHYRRLSYPEERLIFSPYCVDTSFFNKAQETRQINRARVRHELKIKDGQIVLLFVGKLISRKAPDLLIHALKLLSETLRYRIALIFVGDGELKASLEFTAKQESSVDVRFVGFKNQSELNPYYHASDALVLPSNGETWGLVVNEALYHGLPCIVSDRVGCASDLVKPGNTGEVFEAGSVSSLAAAIERITLLLQDSDTAKRCEQLITKYSTEAAAQGIAQAYIEVAKA